MASSFASDPQSERGYPCPKNHFGITDYTELRRFEEPFAAKRGVQLEFSKGHSSFGPAVHLAGALVGALEKLRGEGLLRGLDANGFSVRGASYLGEINAIHPFREGNGRTQREFIRQVALQAGHPLSWAGFRQEQMVDASILSHTKGDNSGLAVIVEAALLSTRGATG